MLKLTPNSTVYYRGVEHVVYKQKDIGSVLIRNKTTNAIEKVAITELRDKAPDAANISDPHDLPMDVYSEKQLKEARKKLDIIGPFLGDLQGNKQEMIKVAEKNDVSVNTLYNWINKFNIYGHVGGLVTSEYKGGKGLGRLDQNVEDKIRETIDEVYIKGKKLKTTFVAVTERLKDLGLEVPHTNTIRRRINQISDYEKTSGRIGARAASLKFDPKVGSMPHARTPLSLVQIDHTLLDIMLVDEQARKPFKRPWITVLIDVFSRVVLGFYISFDAPGAYSVGRAIAHGVLRKDKFLKRIGLSDIDWPVWGRMTTLMCDNAQEFKGNVLTEACAHYQITLKWRPPGKPEKGGHIERYMGTIAEELKDLPGATKVSPELRARFQPEKTASFTLSEFEKWLTVWVTEVYNKRGHHGIDLVAPIDKWQEGILGSADEPGIGLPDIILDEDRFKLDLLPQYKRTVQRTGVHILNFRYYSSVLRKWINAVDKTAKGKHKRKREFIFKMDPHDISSILFLDPSDNKYHAIPTTLNIKPLKMSIWDYRRSIEEAQRSKKPINDVSIFAAFKRLREIENESKRKTKEAQKRNEREKRVNKEEPAKAAEPAQATIQEPQFKISKNEIKPYEELELNTPRRSFK